MSLAFDLYLPQPSPLHRLDPRVKIVGLVLGTLALLSVHNFWVCLAWVGLNALLLAIARVSLARVLGMLRLMLPLSLMVALSWPIFYPEGTTILFSVWRITITAQAVWHGLALALRLNALAQLYFLLLFTTDQMMLVRSLVRLGLPFEWGLTLAIALRYIPTFAGTFQMIAEAQQARGLRLTQGPWVQRLRAYLPILIAMIITALRAVDHLARALEARALGAHPHRTAYKDLRFTNTDWITLLIGAFAAILFFYLRLTFNFGVHPIDLFS